MTMNIANRYTNRGSRPPSLGEVFVVAIAVWLVLVLALRGSLKLIGLISQ